MSVLTTHEARCAEALDVALRQTPAYVAWRACDPGPGAAVDARYRALPALTKRLMNQHGPAGFVPAGRDLAESLRRGEVELVATSGTTEDRIENVWYQPWWDASERASWALHARARRAATGDHREAILVNPLNVGVASATPLSFERRRLGRFLYLNELADPLAWPERHLERMLDELEAFQPAVLEANPSYLALLCRHAARTGRQPFQPALVTLTYEFPSGLHLRQARRVLDAPIASSYGSTEAGYVFMECEHGRLHQNTASCRVDFVPLAAAHGDPRVGQLLVTTFANPWRALLRFDPGDLGRLADGPCPCGRTEGLTLAGIEGRSINLTRTPEGRLVTQADVDRRLAEVPELEGYQLLQLDPRRYALRAVAGSRSSVVLPRCEEALRELYGPRAAITVEAVDAIPPERSGKYRLVKSSVPIDLASCLDPALRPPVPPDDSAPT